MRGLSDYIKELEDELGLLDENNKLGHKVDFDKFSDDGGYNLVFKSWEDEDYSSFNHKNVFEIILNMEIIYLTQFYQILLTFPTLSRKKVN